MDKYGNIINVYALYGAYQLHKVSILKAYEILKVPCINAVKKVTLLAKGFKVANLEGYAKFAGKAFLIFQIGW